MGLLDNALQALKSQYEETKGNVGLLVSDPKRYISGLNQDAAEYNRLSSLALQAERNAYRGIPVSQEQAAAKQYIDQQQQDMALGFAGTVGTAPRKLPLDTHSGELTKYTKALPSGELFRETNANRLMDLFRGNLPYGPEVTYFSEVPEMALGQGSNKGVMLKVNSEGLMGRPYLGKPGLEQSFLQKAGEFEVKEQPSRLLGAINEVWVSPDAYKALRKPEKPMFDKYLKTLEEKGVKVNRVDKLPNSLD